MLRLAIIALLPAAAVLAQTCDSCHPKQAETYKKTGMGRSFYTPSAATQIEDFTRGLPYFHPPSATWYGMVVRNGQWFQTQYQLGFDGKPSGLIEKRIDYVIGSGNHTRTYLSRTPRNTLIELPLAWYSEKGGYWGLNPGYDRPDHDALKRHIDYNCMFCHNAYPRLEGGPKYSGGEAVYPASMPQGIDCQRCHGSDPHQKPVKPDCEQCHLETTSFPLPNSLVRYEREPFSYKPGEPLKDFVLLFDHAPNTGHDDDFEIASSAYQLKKSKCTLKDGQPLTCTTCHDPHNVDHGQQAITRYNAVCSSCHSADHGAGANCVDCHMPKRRADDVVHVVMTDHRIQRNKPARNLVADMPEEHHDGANGYRGEVVPYGPSEELYTATAQVAQGSNMQAGIPRLAAAIRQFQPTEAGHYTALGDAQRSVNQCQEALAAYTDALQRKPGDPAILQKMALCYTSTGQLQKAEQALRSALDKLPDDPKLWTQLGLALASELKVNDSIAALTKATQLDPDLSEAWNDLGGVYLQLGNAAKAEPALREAIRVKPNYSEAHCNLANLLTAGGKDAEAAFHFQLALKLDPNYAFGHFSYGLALGKTGKLADAKAELERSVALDSQSPETHQGLGLVLSALGDRNHAIEQYYAAVKLRPDFPRANLSLGDALAEAGRVGEAIPFLKIAASAPDIAIASEAKRLLSVYAK